MFKKTKRVFLDYASTTPISLEVLSVMRPYFKKKFHNPSALYAEGVATREVVDSARKKVSQIVQVKPEEVIFTGSGTESANLAILERPEIKRKIC